MEDKRKILGIWFLCSTLLSIIGFFGWFLWMIVIGILGLISGIIIGIEMKLYEITKEMLKFLCYVFMLIGFTTMVIVPASALGICAAGMVLRFMAIIVTMIEDIKKHP